MGKICDSCIRNRGIRAFIEEQDVAGKCTFCGRRRARGHVASLRDVRGFIWERIEQDYEAAVNVLPYDGAEGGYQAAETYSASEILSEHIPLDLADEHLDAIMDALAASRDDIDWCAMSPFMLSYFESLSHSWDAFSRAVKWQTRFFFNAESDPNNNQSESEQQMDSDILLPNRLLAETGQLIEAQSMIVVLPGGLRLHRARERKAGESLTTALALGPPPPEKAVRANRMNPPGIPVLYGADDEETAVLETIAPGKRFATGIFETRRPLRCLDLAASLPDPDYFEMDTQPLQALHFLKHFAEAVAAPVVRDDRNHVEYVPTQVVAEYFRRVHGAQDSRIESIRWRSSINGRPCYVVFAGRGDLVLTTAERAHLTESERTSASSGEGWLALVSCREGERTMGETWNP